MVNVVVAPHSGVHSGVAAAAAGGGEEGVAAIERDIWEVVAAVAKDAAAAAAAAVVDAAGAAAGALRFNSQLLRLPRNRQSQMKTASSHRRDGGHVATVSPAKGRR